MKKKTYLKSLGVGGIALLCLCLTTFAGQTLQNGDFSAGLSNWTVEYGSVTDGGGYALFQEHPVDYSSTLSQGFTIPALALDLCFDVMMSYEAGGPYDQFAPPDAFLGSLYDSDGNPLFANPLGVDEFYYLDNTSIVDTTGTLIGNTVRLDVSSLAGQDVLLVFDLWSSYDGMTTTVNLDNVNITVIPAPGALLLGLIGTGLFGLLRKSKTM